MFEIFLLLQKKGICPFRVLLCSPQWQQQLAVCHHSHWNCFTKFFFPHIFSRVANIPLLSWQIHWKEVVFFSSGRCSPRCPPFSAHLAQQFQDDIMFMRILHTAICRRLLSTSKLSLCQVCVTESVLWNTFYPFMDESKCFHWCVVLMGCLERQVPPKWHHYVCSKIVRVQQKDLWFLRKK